MTHAARFKGAHVTTEKLTKRLLEDVVIYTPAVEGETGAQSVAPDHSPRQLYRPREVPPRAAAAPAAESLQHRVEQFLYHQSELLDSKQWRAYIDLFADDGVYWMPAAPEQTEWLDSASIFAEDKMLMTIRMGRVTHPNAWSQAPMWATSHVVGNVVVEADSQTQVSIRSRFQMLELHRDTVRQFAGTYRHTLVRVGDDFKIKLQRVDLLTAQAVFDYVLQVWV
jgi:3-phenylpropionate/cinnamic acid dioxygenase small subunit